MSHPNSLKNLKPFQPGNKLSPGGPRLPPELRAARRENTALLIRLIHQYVGMNSEEAKERLASPAALQIEEMIQGQISKAAEGDSRCFQFIIEMMCGKIPETDDRDSPADNMSPQEKLDALKAMVQIVEREVKNGTNPVDEPGDLGQPS